MNSNGTMIPITGDDMGEGGKEFLDENMTNEEIEFESAAQRRENLKFSNEKFNRLAVKAMKKSNGNLRILSHALKNSRRNR